MNKLTFKELRKIVTPLSNTQQRQQRQQITLFSNRVLNKLFWEWDTRQHKVADILTKGDCCFNHIIGLPNKNGEDKPFFDYGKILFDQLQRQKHIWIKKPTVEGYIFQGRISRDLRCLLKHLFVCKAIFHTYFIHIRVLG